VEEHVSVWRAYTLWCCLDLKVGTGAPVTVPAILELQSVAIFRIVDVVSADKTLDLPVELLDATSEQVGPAACDINITESQATFVEVLANDKLMYGELSE
jgi:hypothetical protein